MVAAAADKVMPHDGSRLYLSHHLAAVEHRVNEKGEPAPVATVAIAGADRVALDSVLEAVWAAGIVPTSVDVTSFALSSSSRLRPRVHTPRTSSSTSAPPRSR